MADPKPRITREYEYDASGIRLTIMCGVTPLYFGEAPDRPENLLHTHSWIEMFCPQEGSVVLFFEDDVQTIHPGEAAIIPSGKYHYAVFSELRDKEYSFNFFIQYFQQNEAAQALRKLLDPEACRYLPVDAVCKNLIQYLADALEQQNSVLCGTYLLALLLNFVQHRNSEADSLQGHSADNKESRIYRIEQAIYTNYTGKLPIKLLAEELHLSQRQVSRIIQQHYGISYRSKVKVLRMQSAARRLESGYSISQVAAAEGYQSLSAFYAAFRRTFGMTPAEYKKAQSQQK